MTMRIILIVATLAAAVSGWAQSDGSDGSDESVESVESVESDEREERQKTGAEGEKALSVEEILGRDPQAEDYVTEQRCVQTTRIREMQVLDEKHVSIQLGRDKYFLVQFEQRCPGLRRGKPIMHEARSNSLCVHDSIRAMQEWGLGQLRPGPRCSIPGFQSITKEQLLHLKDALKAERRKKKQKPA